ncbi:zf-HC2 domain-containing protein [Microbacterium sulfonylureivorans]|uniref:zf-HC2 domain-containing protein n=1 Tax=Microbacterium sulfonylureivorans TaxID=2486854 RepID=UPI000FD8D92C|nr:zf-HC2 domain-containing protein [Microbacterium sulfonylureivorans]
MNADHTRFADWDAAYVLGALSAADRRAFEEHLEGCDACRASIAATAPTIGLLSRVAPDRAQSMLAPPVPDDGPDAAARSRVVELGARDARRRRRARWAGGLTAAAAAVVAIVIAVTVIVAPGPRGVQVVALEPLVDIPLTATVELSDAAWGTRIEMTCRYTEATGDDAPSEGRPYSLVVTAVDGTTSEVSSWRAVPGSTARLSAATALDADEIAAIEIRSLASGRVLMRTELDRPQSSVGAG